MLLAIITYGANSLNADWSMKSVFFFFKFCFAKRAKSLAHDWSFRLSNNSLFNLFNREVVFL